MTGSAARPGSAPGAKPAGQPTPAQSAVPQSAVPQNVAAGAAAARPLAGALPAPIAAAPEFDLTQLAEAHAGTGEPHAHHHSPPKAGPALVRCPRCTKLVDTSLPFCGHCGTRLVPA